MVKNLSTVERSLKTRVGGGRFGEQEVETIILNATDEIVDAPYSGLFVSPIRSHTGELYANTLVYNPETREVAYQISQFNLQEVTEYGASTDRAVTFQNSVTSNDLTVYGNLFVQGETTYLNVANKRIADPLIEIASNNVSGSDAFDAGLLVTRPSGNVAVVYREREAELALSYTANVASDRFIEPETAETINHTVTFNGTAYVIDGQTQPTLTFRRGDTHVFDVAADSMIDNRLRFSESIDGSEYTDGVSTNGVLSGRPGATVTLTVSSSAPLTLYYINLDQTGAGGAIDLSDTRVAGVLHVNVYGDVTSNCYFGEGQYLDNVATLSTFLSNVNRIQILELDASSNNLRTTALEEELSSNNARLTAAEISIDSNAVRTSLVETRLLDNSARLSQLTNYHASNVQRIQNLEIALSDNDYRLTNVESNLVQNSNRISTLSTRLVDNSSRISLNAVNIASNNVRLTNVEDWLEHNSARSSNLEIFASSNNLRVAYLESNTSDLGAFLADNSARATSLEISVPTKAPIDNPTFTGIITGDGSGITSIGFDYVSNLSNETIDTIEFKHSDIAFVTDSRVGVRTDAPSADHALHVDGNIFSTSNVVCHRLVATGTRLDGVENLLTGNVRVTGNLSVLGNVTNISARNVFIQDPILGLGNPDVADSGVIVSTTETLGNVCFGYNLTDREYVIAFTQDGPDGLTLTPDNSKDLNVHVYGTVYSQNAFGISNTSPYSAEYALSIGDNVFARHDGDLVSIRSLADTGIFSANVTTPEIVSSGDYITLTAPTTIVGGNLEVRGQTAFVSTADIKINDALVELAITNTLKSTDLGFRMKRPDANVLVAYKGVDEEFVFAHAGTGETPDVSKQMNVHVYGSLFADTSINVNSNCFINYDGVIEASAYKGDGGLLSNVRSTFQSITENGPWPAGPATDLTVTFANVLTGIEVTEGNVVVSNIVYAEDFVGVGGANVGGVAWSSHLVDNAQRVSTLEQSLTQTIGELDSNAARVSTLEQSLTQTITELDSNAQRVSTLEQSLTQTIVELDSNAQRVSTLEPLVSQTIVELDSNAQRVSTLEPLVSQTIVELDSNAQRVSTLEQSLTQTIGELDSNAARVSTLEQSLTQTITELDSNAQRVSTLEQSLTQTIVELDSNAQRVSTLEPLVSQTIVELDSNAQRVSTLEPLVSQTIVELDSNAQRVSTLEQSLTQTITELNSNAQRVSTLEPLVSQTIVELDSNAARVSTLEQSLTQTIAELDSNAATLLTKAPLYDPTFTNNIEVSGNAIVHGNLTVSGELTYLSTDNTVLKDAIIQLANSNASQTLDQGFVLTHPTSNIAFGWRGDETEFMFARSQSDASGSDLAPLAGSSLHLHNYGPLTADGDLEVGTGNLVVDVSTSRVGINSSSPGVALDVVGDGAFTVSNDTSVAGPVVTLHRDSSTPDDGDYLGQVKFTGKNDAGATKTYAKMTAKTSDVTQNTEDGLFERAVHKDGSVTIVERLTSTHLKLENGTGLTVAGQSDLTGRLAVAYDTDTASFLGRAAVGYAGVSDEASFAHLDNNTTTAYALKQNADGVTSVNGASNVIVCSGGAESARFTSAGYLGINTDEPAYELDVDGDIHCSGFFRGDAGLMSNLASNLHQIALNGNVTSNTLRFTNALTAFTTDLSADVGIKLDQLNEITISGKSTNDVLLWDGTAWIDSPAFSDNASALSTLQTDVSSLSGWLSDNSSRITANFDALSDNASRVSSLETGKADLLNPTFTSNVTINGGLVIGKTAGVAKKHYSYAGELTSLSNIGISFGSNVFYAKVVAQLVHDYDDVSTMVVEVSGGKRPVGGTLQDIAIGTKNKWGRDSYPWSSDVITDENTVILEPYVAAGTGNYEYDLYVEYISSEEGGACTNIKEGSSVVHNFSY